MEGKDKKGERYIKTETKKDSVNVGCLVKKSYKTRAVKLKKWIRGIREREKKLDLVIETSS